ncbi:sugar transferase [Actinomyces weissii]|uniref:Sugar transferase n=1 Tax=Actinomyces weissii TaxID=675090 RepID=A0A7T7MAV2_9ACTO|nr:sugar transferase [Actinomyces weissii]QQM67930.1 sugar transferase [Actinomyces weissii]
MIDSEDFARDSRQLDNRSFGYKAVKRVFDLLVSTLVIVIGAGPGLLLTFFIWRSTGGSPIYSQTRVGLYGKRFRIYKFRTMVADSDNIEKYFTPEQLEVWKRERKVDHDPRITRLGRFLRATSVDELPNFINVFLGQMSTVGPRAIAVDELQWFGGYAPELVSVTPGITGWWQVTDRNEAMYDTGARQERELHYVRNASIWMDCMIIVRTAKTIVRCTGR